MPINISNEKKRDAKVVLESVNAKSQVRLVDQSGRETKTLRLLKCDVEHDLEHLLGQFNDVEQLFDALKNGDPEVDIDLFGKQLFETTRVYVSKGKVVFHVNQIEIICNPDGTERVRRPRVVESQNINADIPLVWSGKFIEKKVAIRKFVFTLKKQIIHNNGLTFDFLFEIAKDLHERDSLMILGAGSKGDKPLILQRGGKNYRGFLEGRIDGDKYCLLLHLSEMELKMPKNFSSGEAKD